MEEGILNYPGGGERNYQRPYKREAGDLTQRRRADVRTKAEVRAMPFDIGRRGHKPRNGVAAIS